MSSIANEESKRIVNLSCPSSSSSSAVSSSKTTAKASSTWQHNIRKFGPQNALDTTSDDAWKSGPTSSNNELGGNSSSSSINAAQYYEIYFHRLVQIHEIRVQFQGGFVGLDCGVYKHQDNTNSDNDSNDEDNSNLKWEEMEELYMDPIDTTDVQSFYSDIEVDNVSTASSSPTNQAVTAIRIEFGKSTDFYGRIVLYSIEVWGMEISE
jgi:hypothetical protein